MNNSIIPSKKQCLAGWGNTPTQECVTYRPEKKQEIADIISNHPNTIIARGQGRSYGDASLNPSGVILTERLNHFLAFDKEKGILSTQAGVTLAEILDIVIPYGWFLPVIPGTKHVSVGGAFACNIHGKNHYKEGDIAQHTLSITLRLTNGELRECSHEQYSDIFWATAGGMGLTGIIETVTLQLKKIHSLSLKSHTKKVKSLSEMLACFNEHKKTSDYMIGWIDHFAKNTKCGQGVFEYANHISEKDGGKPLKEYIPPKSGITIPSFFPSILLNKYSMALYNQKRFARYSKNWKEEVVDFHGFFHPLDSLIKWNRLYGKKGFYQYQFILPESPNVAEQLTNILSYIQSVGLFSFLAVIKYHGDHQGLLSFPIRGYSIALDFPNTPEVQQLQASLNDQVTDLGGRVYLAKDALLTEKHFKKMYHDNFQEWETIVAQINPDAKINSLLSQRIQLQETNND